MIFNQVLHGYENGHTLLASSIELPAEIKREMLPMSDMSGGSMIKGFEEYITGYPLKQLNIYAIAKTWYAPEMKRPGCVWTHTILIDFNDLPNLDDAAFLLSVFKRPPKEKVDYSLYSSLIHTEALKTQKGIEKTIGLTKSVVLQIFKSLYEQDDKAVLITSPSSNEAELLFPKIWQQQWPRLRRNFSFCTGSISIRNMDGFPLDLQAVPFKADTLSFINDLVVINQDEQAELKVEPWLELTYNELTNPSGQLKTYFSYFGSDLRVSRSSFKALAQSFVFFAKKAAKLDDSINFLAKTFPASEEATSLKVLILGGQFNSFSNFLPKYDEEAILFRLSITSSAESFDFKKLNYLKRFYDYFQDLDDYKIKLLKEIIKVGPNHFGEDAITSLANQADNLNINSLWADKQLSAIFVTLNPRLTYNKAYWEINKGHQIEIINQLQKHDVNSKVDWKIVIRLLLDTDSNIDLNIFQNSKVAIEPIVLDWINKKESSIPGKNWLTYLKKNPASIFGWLNEQNVPKLHAINVIVDLLNPNSRQVFENGLGPWLKFLRNQDSMQFWQNSKSIQSFCLTIAFNRNDSDAKSVFTLTFENIYFFLATEQLDYSLWRELEVHTKPLSFWKDWDKCKKITNALVDKYILNDWSINEFVKQIHSRELKEIILKRHRKKL